MDSEKALNINNGPSLCSNGCGFFGSPSTKNLCSKCYNDFLKHEVLVMKSSKTCVSSIDKALAISPKTTITAAVFPSAYDDHQSTIAVGIAAMSFSDAKRPKKINRCESCNKKVGLLGFECRCGGLFCGVHRYAEKHSCTHDFKVVGRNVLAKENPLCIADKQKDRI